MYHNVGPPPPGAHLPSLYVTPAQLARHFELLRLMGFREISMSDALPYLRGERGGRVAVLTFDDGYRDNLEHALPLLRRFGFGATCYVPSGALGRFNLWDAELLNVRKPVMDAGELRAWVAEGLEIGAHSRSHPRLSTCPPERLRGEVRGSKEDLQDLLGCEVSQFCYPFGDYDARVLGEVREAGFVAATAMRRGRARPGDDPLQLRRVLVRGTEGIGKLLLKLATPYEDRRGQDLTGS
ncbi:MAG: polysaccharide deacetylase family protein [Gemmatimonadota bacterium]|nr:polysaccharide deacetylase family protein [Gemmatimonadota bacterium]